MANTATRSVKCAARLLEGSQKRDASQQVRSTVSDCYRGRPQHLSLFHQSEAGIPTAVHYPLCNTGSRQ